MSQNFPLPQGHAAEGEPLRIAILAHLHHPISSPFLGGLEMHTSLMADEFASRGHDVTLFGKAGSESRGRVVDVLGRSFEFQRGLAPEQMRRQQQTLDDALGRAVAAVRTGDFDIVVNNSLSLLPYLELADLPLLTILHTPPLPWIIDAVEDGRAPLSPLHRFVSVSARNATGWSAHLPNLQVIHNGIRLADWPAGTPRRPGTAVWAGRVTPEKGLHIAIDAARMAGMELHFAGPVSDEKYFERSVAPHLGRGVHHVGHLDHRNLAGFLGSGEVFIASPVWSEPFGLTALEAMACGTPVAALPLGAMPEIIDADGGRLAEGLGPDALAAAITEARRIDRDGVRRSAARFSAAAMVGAYEDQIRSLLDPDGLPSQPAMPDAALIP
ncbi:MULTISPECIES: glycosyltransferase [unclassified Arthrobacter]|uniref:glycosyltransferase n=1 Tax=unclassified Arthrobacter TaxID=235627 RepID=UPI001E580072|nr:MULTISPECIES: glycosyltransferase [unclassified Arthrobacter]MCC9145314.1 glycosyltransferase [Arthrobacter sp. zg-Y919]MDK1276542.1 glycosyltransferase [Arthrobacter sp. zg.Y919]WIB01865.1 glycosyltransferase [Arthrobacter sp. zg-Y919]